MRTGLTKKQKTTVIYFDEHSRIIEVQTHNTDLKKRLTAFAAKHPQCCRQTDDDEQGGLTFEIEKGQFAVIVGPSGAGKTTLLNILGGMDSCDEGNVWLDGQNVSHFTL